MTLEERLSRTICWKNGMNPDLTLGGDGQNFLWHEYIPQASAVISELKTIVEFDGIDELYRLINE